MSRALLVLLLSGLASAAPPFLQREGEVLRFGNGLAELIVAPGGRIQALGPPGGPPLAQGASVELLADGRWLGRERIFQESALVREAVVPGAWIVGAPDSGNPGGTTLELRYLAGDWRLTEQWRLFDNFPLAVRTATWTYVGSGSGTIENCRFRLDGCRFATANGGELILPGPFPVERHAVRELAVGRVLAGGSSSSHNQLLVLTDAETSLIALVGGEAEAAGSNVVVTEAGLSLEHWFPVRLRYGPGVSFSVGAQVIGLAGAGPEAVAGLTAAAFERFGLRTVSDGGLSDRELVYSAQVAGTIDSGFKDTGGFKAFTARLPQIRALGVTILWLLPFWKGSVYAPVDYHQVDPAWGTEAELKELVERAHALGMRVVGDLVPHGPRESSGLLDQHPEWVTRKPDGQVTYMWGCLQCDYAHPGWQRYMAEHAADWMRRVGLDGYRVDVASGGPPNWQPYGELRPSMSGTYGSRRLMAAVRRAIKAVKPDAILIPEGTSPALFESGDLVYDFPWAYAVLPEAAEMGASERREAVASWLTWRRALYPPGARFMRYAESHDTARAGWRYGPTLHREFLQLARTSAVPMLYDGEEQGLVDLFRELDPPPLPRAESSEGLSITMPAYRATFDPARGGALVSVTRPDGTLLLRGDGFAEQHRKLFVGVPPIDLEASAARVEERTEGEARLLRFTTRVPVAAPKLEVVRAYRCRPGTIELETTLTPLEPIERVSARLVQSFLFSPGPWRAETLMGTLAGDGRELRLRRESGPGFRYRHDPARWWEAALLPLHGAVGAAGVWLSGPQAEPADWSQNAWLQPVADGQRPALRLSLGWLDGRAVTRAAGQPVKLTCRLHVGEPPPAPEGGFDSDLIRHENASYQLVLRRGRGGRIVSLRARRGDGWGPDMVDTLVTYTDRGLYGDYVDPAGNRRPAHITSEIDLEPEVRLKRSGSSIRVTFEGTLRSAPANGQPVVRPYAWYRHEYILDDSPIIRMRLAFRPRAGLEWRETEGFVAHRLGLAGVAEWHAHGADGEAGGAVKGGGRVWQSAAHGGLGPEGFRLSTAGGTLLARPGGSVRQNDFIHDSGNGRISLFLALLDGRPERLTPVWRESTLELEVR